MRDSEFYKIKDKFMEYKAKYRLLGLVLISVLAAGYYLYVKDGGIQREQQADTETGVIDEAIEAQEGQVVLPDENDAGEEKESAEKFLFQAKTIEGIPFASQSPFGDWADPRQQHGCEEASLLMARYFLTGEELSKEKALTEIFAMSAYEEENYGGPHDLSLEDTLELYRAYFGYEKSFVKYDIDTADIKREIAKGNPVIVPIDGTKLGNPYYTAPGPERHELIVIGYDDVPGEFITHDPGTRFGEGYRYDYGVFVDAIRAYETGNEISIESVEKGMLVIEKE